MAQLVQRENCRGVFFFFICMKSSSFSFWPFFCCARRAHAFLGGRGYRSGGVITPHRALVGVMEVAQPALNERRRVGESHARTDCGARGGLRRALLSTAGR